jgi:hypothetical protein
MRVGEERRGGKEGKEREQNQLRIELSDRVFA